MDSVTDHTFSNQLEQQTDKGSGPSNKKLLSMAQGIQPELMVVSHITERLDSLIQLLGNGILAQAIQSSPVRILLPTKVRTDLQWMEGTYHMLNNTPHSLETDPQIIVLGQ